MLAHEQFGIPVPIIESNPYRLSVENALFGEVSVPEGALKGLKPIYFDPWFSELRGYLEANIGAPFPYKVETHPVPKYKFHVSSYYVTRALQLPLKEFSHKVPTVSNIIALLRKSHAREDLQEFYTFLKRYSEPEVFKKYCDF